jgi:hypothetical protein
VDISKILISLVPLILVSMWWVVDSINTLNSRVVLIEQNLSHLISPSGEIKASSDNEIERAKIKEILIEDIHNLEVRLYILEEKLKAK